MNFPLFIARRIYGKGAGSQKVAKPAIRIATAGVAIGLAVMIVTVSVILGFKHTIRDKVVGFGSHITVANIASLMSSDQYPIQMDDSMTTVLRKIPGVRHVERYAMTQGILKTDDDFLGVALKGVGPEYDTTFIHQNMVEGSIPPFLRFLLHAAAAHLEDHCRPAAREVWGAHLRLFHQPPRGAHAPLHHHGHLRDQPQAV